MLLNCHQQHHHHHHHHHHCHHRHRHHRQQAITLRAVATRMVSTTVAFLPLSNTDSNRIGYESDSFPTAQHREMILPPPLRLLSSMGTSESLGRGCAQYLSAGTGITHSEMNAGDEVWVHDPVIELGCDGGRPLNMYMHVCMYVYICICIYVYMYICMCIYMYSWNCRKFSEVVGRFKKLIEVFLNRRNSLDFFGNV